LYDEHPAKEIEGIWLTTVYYDAKDHRPPIIRRPILQPPAVIQPPGRYNMMPET
jgi:hypothetical protein